MRTASPELGGAFTKGARRTSIRYPNGRLVHYGYGATGSIGDATNRVAAIQDDDNGSLGATLAAYSYLGQGGIVQVDYQEPDLRYDLAHGAGNDPYAGLDRFDRVVDLLWRNYGVSTDVVRIQHGYDRAGNRLWREDPVAAASSVHLDELYAYDGMSQLTHRERGDLNVNHDAITSKNFAEAWALDMTGNWPSFKQDTDGNGTWDLDQSRTHDASNQIAQIAGSPSHIAHDRAGNMVKTPKPDNWSAHYDLTWDAWNRLVKVMDGETVVATYAYDGRNFRVTKTVSGTTRHFYYSSAWQCLEERLLIPNPQSLIPVSQNVWGLRYIDDLVIRDRDGDGNSGTGNLGLSGSGLEERLYGLQDANWNVVAITSTAGAAQERYCYDAYGRSTVLAGIFGSRALSSYDWETRYTGRPLDEDTGFQDNRNRWYAGYLGRWLSRDPLEADINLYRYCANNPLLYTDPTGRDWLDCMAECIKDNDPLPYALGAGIKAILLTGGWETKAMVAQMFKALEYTELAKDILHYANMPGASKLTNIMSTIGTVLSKMGTTQSTAMWHKLGGAASSILGPIEVAYGLSLAAIEVHCTGWCCTAWWYGIPYNHADGNVINAWKNYYFGKWL